MISPSLSLFSLPLRLFFPPSVYEPHLPYTFRTLSSFSSLPSSPSICCFSTPRCHCLVSSRSGCFKDLRYRHHRHLLALPSPLSLPLLSLSFSSSFCPAPCFDLSSSPLSLRPSSSPLVGCHLPADTTPLHNWSPPHLPIHSLAIGGLAVTRYINGTGTPWVMGLYNGM